MRRTVHTLAAFYIIVVQPCNIYGLGFLTGFLSTLRTLERYMLSIRRLRRAPQRQHSTEKKLCICTKGVVTPLVAPGISKGFGVGKPAGRHTSVSISYRSLFATLFALCRIVRYAASVHVEASNCLPFCISMLVLHPLVFERSTQPQRTSYIHSSEPSYARHEPLDSLDTSSVNPPFLPRLHLL